MASEQHLSINVAGRPGIFTFPKRGATEQFVRQILEGNSYPVFVDDQFKPKIILDIGANDGTLLSYYKKKNL